MSYIGSTPTSQAFAPGTDTFSGTGSQTAFTLSRNVATVNDIQVVVNNVVQQPSNYTVASNILTFSPAPSVGTDNIYVRYLSTNLQTIAPQQGSVTRQALDIGSGGAGTGAAQMPVGTTAQRPSIPLAGMYRLNTTTGDPEWYSSATSSWLTFSQNSSYLVEYLVIAGGGGGDGGGGGAGGVVSASTTLSIGTAITVTVGAGGLNPSVTGGGNNSATSGNNSSFGAIATATGGGAGRYQNQAGVAGGSGGGGGYIGFAGGAGTSGQGFAGGSAGSTAGGGGGGAGAIGSNGSGATAGAGGAGTNTYSVWATATSSGVSGFYAGGGGGGSSGGGAAGGSGGGGNGGNVANSVAGTANTGGGGGGIYSSYPAANGGSGIVIVRYLGAQRGTGGTVTTSGGYTYHRFTTSGTFTA